MRGLNLYTLHFDELMCRLLLLDRGLWRQERRIFRGLNMIDLVGESFFDIFLYDL